MSHPLPDSDTPCPGWAPKPLLRPQTSSAAKPRTSSLSHQDDIPKSLFPGTKQPPGCLPCSQQWGEHRFPSICSNLSHS